MNDIKELARLLGVEEEKADLVRKAGLSSFKVKGKVGGLLTPKYAVIPSGKKLTVIVEEGVIEKLSPDSVGLIREASKYNGQVVVDTTKGRVFVKDGDVRVLYGKDGVEAVASLRNAGRLAGILSGKASDETVAVLKGLSRGAFILDGIVKGLKAYTDGESVHVVLPDGSSVKIRPDGKVPGWKELTAGVIYALVRNGVVGKETIKGIRDADVRKIVKGMLEKRLLPLW